jgi:iron complex outermembrane receptor protein
MQFSEYVRLNNIADKKYVGSVIVGDTNQRYFEPAPGRNWFVGATIGVTL